MDTYRIVLSDASEWKGWRVSTSKVSERVLLEKQHVWPITGEVLGVTTIQVFKNQAMATQWDLSEEKVADEIRALEEKTMLEEGVKKGEYALEYVRNDTVTIAGKKLYRMSYKAQKGSWVSSWLLQRPIVEAALIVYVPSSYRETGSFYEFHINESYKPGRPVEVNLGRIFSVISGFEMKLQRQ